MLSLEEVYLVKKVVRLTTTMEGSNYWGYGYNVIYKAFCFDVGQGRMNGAPNETRTHSCRFASLAC